MAVTVYNSTDASAPVLTNAIGSLIALLDACLVNGYGALAAAGWTKPYAGTNLAVYRQGTGNQMYLRVDDTATIAARVYGLETSTGINTGTGLFPQNNGFAGGLYWHKAYAVDANPRAWTIIATSKAFYLWVNANNETSVYQTSAIAFFGDIQPTKSNDLFHTMIVGATTNGSGGNAMYTTLTSLAGVSPGHYMARSYHQVGSYIPLGKHSDGMRGSTNGMGRGNIPFPNPVNGATVLAPVWVHEPNNTLYPVRGVMPGMWNICHAVPFNHGDTFPGTGTLAGKTLQVFNMWNGGSTPSQCAIEISNTW